MNFIKTWVDALRSGKYKQGAGFLKYQDRNGEVTHCCLGVAAELIDPSCKALMMQAQTYNEGVKRSWAYYLTDELKAKLEELVPNIRFTCSLSSRGGWSVRVTGTHVATMNDQEVSFDEIADALEKEYLSDA